MADVQITDNSAKVLSALEQATARALEIIGGKAESYDAMAFAGRQR